ALGESIAGVPCRVLAAGFSPWQAILEAVRPYTYPQNAPGIWGNATNIYLVSSIVIALLLNGVAIAKIRIWNPSREATPIIPEEEVSGPESIFGTDIDGQQSLIIAKIPAVSGSAPIRTRSVWDNPIIWREMRTWAYGRKILAIRLAYLLLFAFAAGGAFWLARQEQPISGPNAAMVLVPVFLLSLILVNAQAVTSLTSERDARALDLLLVTDLTPKEIVFGKLGGVFYNTKEMVILPILLCVYLYMSNAISLENTIFLLLGLAILYFFTAVLGIHAGMTYANSGSAIAASLGTVFFLTIGVAACMRIMLAFSGSFQAQFVPFFAYMVLGGVGLYVVLGVRNPSTAIGVASFLCPFATFYAITSYLLGATLAMFLAVVAAYGFTTAAMLVPAIYEFDVATGRTTIEE
ncbi:MAG TPA: hypothetical protein VIH42_10855, partial [Thermoguttaceae bacterium]